ncbi:fimbria/pilus periplasmic chaperone [Aeromonas sp. 604176]|uniref:fimbria/pilus periplasmic chaperone n=1 Tax=Aeromonas sp. 604176 TaxID=2712052 RepID=UPI003BA206C8
MRKFLLFIYIFPVLAFAFDIGPMTANMAPGLTMLTRTVTNMSDKPKAYLVSAVRISNPKANGIELPMKSGELLFAPKRFLLAPRGTENVKLYYKGPNDNKERYYRVTFTESPAAQKDTQLRNSSSAAALDINIALQSVLVVRPRKVKMDYQADLVKGLITNTGNTYFEFMVKEGCHQSDSVADSKFLLPGETYHNKKIKEDSNQKFIVYDDKFIPIGNECW